MSKRSTPTNASDEGVPVVGGREPCPCGSGRRYKACHGKQRAAQHRVVRPFEGFASEPDWVALHDLVSAASSPLSLRDDDRELLLCTLLPMAWPALVRESGSVLLAAQTQTASGDYSRDIADALSQALKAKPGSTIAPRPLPADGPRLDELIDTSKPLAVRVHSGFDYWLEDADSADGADDTTRAALERANAAVVPTARLAAVEAAYWMQLGDRRQLRWVLPQDETPLVDALARMQVADGLSLIADSRFLGSFRASGLVVPVWDLPDGTEVEDVEDSAAEFSERLQASLKINEPLSGAERRAREALRARQLTVH